MSFEGSFFYLYGGTDKDGKDIWDAFDNTNIFKESLKGAVEIQDLDSTRNAEGLLVRNVLSHRSFSLEFQIPPCWDSQMRELWTMIRSHYTKDNERKLKVRYYNHESGGYLTGDFYIATPTFNVGRVEGNKIFYNAMTINMIKY